MQRFNRVYVNQAAVDDTVLLGVGDDDFRLRKSDALRMVLLVNLAVRKADDKWFERLSPNELAKCFNRHGSHLLKSEQACII